jgi:hypothetical protein
VSTVVSPKAGTSSGLTHDRCCWSSIVGYGMQKEKRLAKKCSVRVRMMA